jgi:2-keto-4-pentenoate hydratase/2-oxohepta-3-ene-1,7-dioic acid hydratase in catechol pathway
VARPGKIICLGLNYLEHVKEGRYADNLPKFPTLFMRGLNSIVPHLSPLIRPRVSETFDYEAELVAVIGQRAKHMRLDNALSCVAGWTCCNEGSIREFQRHTTQWHMGKNFDHTGSMGPWVVDRRRAQPGRQGLKIESRLNGRDAVRQYREHDVPGRRNDRLCDPGRITLEPGRSPRHRHAVGP